jgi:signal transduction histidine kinase
MLKDSFPSLYRGIEKLRSNPQLWYTILVAFLILVAFVFVANRFVSIAQDAQDRLVQERLGALQDSFVEFTPDYLSNDKDVLRDKIRKMAFLNPTIRDFKIIEFTEGQPMVAVSLVDNEVGEIDSENNLRYQIAETDKNTSYIFEGFDGDERMYTTIRIIPDSYGNSIGAVITENSLSESDLKISQNINNSVIIFIIIIFLVMFLFFRHARIIDYSTLYRKLEEVDHLKDDFISMASHELRTPLTIIRGYAENLKDNPEDPEKSINRIDVAAKQLDDLVNDMLDVSRIEQGRMQVEKKNISPITIISDVVSGLVPVAENKGLKLDFKHTLQNQEEIFVDPDRFRQMLVNLVGNAVKYTKKGEVRVRLSSDTDSVIIRISDTGVGMSSEAQNKLFEKFYRIKTKETEDVRGTGLGLWITKQIVDLMGGKISVESIEGVGTHFIVTFNKVR